jgi:hypothetical protein
MISSVPVLLISPGSKSETLFYLNPQQRVNIIFGVFLPQIPSAAPPQPAFVPQTRDYRVARPPSQAVRSATNYRLSAFPTITVWAAS